MGIITVRHCPPYLLTASDQILKAGAAWKRGYVYVTLKVMIDLE